MQNKKPSTEEYGYFLELHIATDKERQEKKSYNIFMGGRGSYKTKF